MNLSKELLNTIACPKCYGTLEQVDESLHCENCQLSYPIDDGIPMLLVEEAKPIE